MDFVALLLCLVVWNHCVYFETFKYYYHWILGLFYYALSSENLVSTLKLLNIYYYWILVALLLRLVIWNHRVYFETFKQYYCWILVALLLRLVIWKSLVYFETFKQYYYWILWLFYYALSSEMIVSTLKLLNTTIIGFWGSFTTPCHLKTSCLLWNF